jgi:hypothetical protein
MQPDARSPKAIKYSHPALTALTGACWSLRELYVLGYYYRTEFAWGEGSAYSAYSAEGSAYSAYSAEGSAYSAYKCMNAHHATQMTVL